MEHAGYGLGGGSIGGYLGYLVGEAVGEEKKYPKVMKKIPLAEKVLDFQERKKPVHVLSELKHAKELSDSDRYMEKTIIVHDLLKNRPKEFELSDQDKHGYVGIVHKKTGFKLHHPSYMLPAAFVKTLDRENLREFVPKM